MYNWANFSEESVIFITKKWAGLVSQSAISQMESCYPLHLGNSTQNQLKCVPISSQELEVAEAYLGAFDV